MTTPTPATTGHTKMKRYELSGDCDGESGRCLTKMTLATDGAFVLFEDPDSLRQSHARLLEACHILIPQVTILLPMYQAPDTGHITPASSIELQSNQVLALYLFLKNYYHNP